MMYKIHISYTEGKCILYIFHIFCKCIAYTADCRRPIKHELSAHAEARSLNLAELAYCGRENFLAAPLKPEVGAEV